MTTMFAVTALFLFGIQARADAFPIFDALAEAPPTTHFSRIGNGGVTIGPTQSVGPQFILTQPTILTEIGGFLNTSTGSSAFTVNIHRSKAGVPDPNAVEKKLVLSHDRDPLIVSYESVATHLVLGPGTYFALFSPQDGGEGYILAGASDPFAYRARLTTLGCLGTSCRSQTVFEGFAAVRVVGEPVAPGPKPSTFLPLDSVLSGTTLISTK